MMHLFTVNARPGPNAHDPAAAGAAGAIVNALIDIEDCDVAESTLDDRIAEAGWSVTSIQEREHIHDKRGLPRRFRRYWRVAKQEGSSLVFYLYEHD